MNCDHCGANVTELDRACPACGTESALAAEVTTADADLMDAGPDPVLRHVIPVGRSLTAVAAGYAGLLSILLFPAPLALLLGVVAIYRLKANPHKLGWGRAIFGLVMGALGTAALLIVFLTNVVRELG